MIVNGDLDVEFLGHLLDGIERVEARRRDDERHPGELRVFEVLADLFGVARLPRLALLRPGDRAAAHDGEARRLGLGPCGLDGFRRVGPRQVDVFEVDVPDVAGLGHLEGLVERELAQGI